MTSTTAGSPTRLQNKINYFENRFAYMKSYDYICNTITN